MSTTLASIAFGELLEQLGAKTPTPGGGAAACANGALAAALAQMVVSYSLGKKSLAAHQGELERGRDALLRAREVLLELADEDAAAYGLVNELMRLPEGDARRTRELPAALAASIQVPMAAIATSTELLRLCESLAPITNTQLHSDLAIAAVLAESAARASQWNVRVNAAMLGKPEEAARITSDAHRAVEDAARRRAAVEQACGR
jgi:formiminotetrahydrofolate cyclodeaminase